MARKNKNNTRADQIFHMPVKKTGIRKLLEKAVGFVRKVWCTLWKHKKTIATATGGAVALTISASLVFNNTHHNDSRETNPADSSKTDYDCSGHESKIIFALNSTVIINERGTTGTSPKCDQTSDKTIEGNIN